MRETIAATEYERSYILDPIEKKILDLLHDMGAITYNSKNLCGDSIGNIHFDKLLDAVESLYRNEDGYDFTAFLLKYLKSRLFGGRVAH